MSAPAFTRGPWYATEPFAGFASIKQVETDALIFGIAAGDPEEKQSDDVCDANATLIASAPDLYEAAKEVFDGLNARIDAAYAAGEPVPVFKGIAALSDALNKARGEARASISDGGGE